MVSKVLVVLICAASILRLLFLETSPPGFYIDEAMGAANADTASAAKLRLCLSALLNDLDMKKSPMGF